VRDDEVAATLLLAARAFSHVSLTKAVAATGPADRRQRFETAIASTLASTVAGMRSNDGKRQPAPLGALQMSDLAKAVIRMVVDDIVPK